MLNYIHRFNPRTPCGVRHLGIEDSESIQLVSIHALLAECDAEPAVREPRFSSFQSTHSLRSATQGNSHCQGVYRVSIHALLAECDRTMHGQTLATGSFNPRTPCGVRQVCQRGLNVPGQFQSTHSLRSATQPTLYITTQQSKSYFAPTSLKRPSLHGYTF